MNRYKLSKAGINATEGIARFGGNKEIYEQMLLNFLTDDNFEKLCSAIANKDIKTAFMAAHSLKGVAGNLSMRKMYDDIYPLVEELRAGSFDHSETLLDPVKEDYIAAISAITPV